MKRKTKAKPTAAKRPARPAAKRSRPAPARKSAASKKTSPKRAAPKKAPAKPAKRSAVKKAPVKKAAAKKAPAKKAAARPAPAAAKRPAVRRKTAAKPAAVKKAPPRDSYPPTPSRAPDSPAGKMMLHGDEVGNPGAADASRRAREIALIGDHPVGPDDRAEAERELEGEGLPSSSASGGDAAGSLSRDPSDPAVDRGHQAPSFEGDDEQEVAERLVTEGVEEADHDQMVEGHRKRPTE